MALHPGKEQIMAEPGRIVEPALSSGANISPWLASDVKGLGNRALSSDMGMRLTRLRVVDQEEPEAEKEQ